MIAAFSVCLSLFSAAFAYRAENAQPSAAVFPAISSYALDKSKITLPGELKGKYDVLILSFEREQQQQVDSWMPAAEAVQHTHFNVHYYQVPVFPRENILYRWWENSSMRSDVSDPEMWQWVVPVYVDRQQFDRALQIASEKQVAVLLVDKAGRVLWRSEGAVTPEKRSSLDGAVAALTVR